MRSLKYPVKRNSTCRTFLHQTLIYVLAFTGFVIVSVSHASEVPITDVVKDQALARCIDETMQKEGADDVLSLVSLKCHGKGIRSLEGINHFKALTSLSLFNNKIETVPTLELPSLKLLNLARNRIQNLVLSAVPELENLYVFDNRLVSLELRNLSKLHNLKANKNKLKLSHFERLPALEKVYLFDNELETIAFEVLPALKYMDVRQNPMPDALYERMDQVESTTFLHDGNAEDWQ